MATSQKLTEHFLTCTICTEVFDNPCTLVCNHTFCRKCIVIYTKTRPEAISAKSLLCPFCNKMTKVSAPERPVEEWADDVKPMFVIQGLLDSFGPGSKDTTNCSYCREKGETTPAVVWCSVCDDALCGVCARIHRRNPSSRHHDVDDLSGEVKVKRKRKVMCREHTEDCTEFLCEDCKLAACHKCCTLYHRRCSSVVTIESKIPAMKTELAKKKEKFLKRRNRIETQMQKQKLKVDEEPVRYTEIVSSITTTSKKAIEQIKVKKRNLLEELKEMSDKHIGQLKSDIKSGEMSVQMYQQQAELIDQALQSECDMDVYEMYQGCEAGDLEAVGDADLKGRGRITSLTFKRSKTLGDLQLGEIDVLYEAAQDPKATPMLQDNTNVLDLKATPVLLGTINVGVAGDSHIPAPLDVTVLVVNGADTVVVTDYINNSVKSFYPRNNQTRHSKLSLGGGPWNLTKLTHNRVAVTLPYAKQILTVEVNPDMVLLSTITASKKYWGITSLTPSTLAASSQIPPCVDILDMTGNVLRSLSPLHNGKNILQTPNCLCSTRTGDILVCDRDSNFVMCLTPEGDVVFNYSRAGDKVVAYAAGITSTSTGDILVTDNAQHSAIHLSETGVFEGKVLAHWDIMQPCGICIHGRGRVFVSSSSAGVVKVFKFEDTVWDIVSRLPSTCTIL